MASCSSLNFTAISSNPQKLPSSSISSPTVQRPFISHLSFSKSSSLHSDQIPIRTHCGKLRQPNGAGFVVLGCSRKKEPLRIMISGAPASGKGTQCELITQKPDEAGCLQQVHIINIKLYGLVHIAAGDLLRAEIAAGSENGKQAKEYMDKGKLVPNEIVVAMVKDRLNGPDSREKGWLLDGYPRSSSQAIALREFGFQPNLFILLEVPEEILVERVVGRRLDPVTGKIYHLKYSPPETEEIASRVTQRFDDTEEKVKLRLQTHRQNVEAVLSTYEDITVKVNGSGSKHEVFAQIDGSLTQLLEQKQEKLGTVAA
ncbi:adenylate kinase, chloroplastic-like isoform X1 [Solanum pennellii]|uniref:adenylate kinase n=1 Tax=Solanum pennellii TaxID=28526 RepID=A0ABM1FLZ0_SOLPN|nr:adenylate kinase, chloroplastic-like isoform X1 [Solanum pennellii]